MLKAQQGGTPLALIPLVMVAMNLVYACSAYPFGKLSDRMSHEGMLKTGLLVLIAADVVLALSDHWAGVLFGVALWGVHMGMTQGLLAAMVAHTAPAHLRGTAFGMFNLVSGVALLLASLGAGTLWELFGSASTFYAGAIVCVVTLAGMQLAPFSVRRPWRRRRSTPPRGLRRMRVILVAANRQIIRVDLRRAGERRQCFPLVVHAFSVLMLRHEPERLLG